MKILFTSATYPDRGEFTNYDPGAFTHAVLPYNKHWVKLLLPGANKIDEWVWAYRRRSGGLWYDATFSVAIHLSHTTLKDRIDCYEEMPINCWHKELARLQRIGPPPNFSSPHNVQQFALPPMKFKKLSGRSKPSRTKKSLKMFVQGGLPGLGKRK